MASDAVMLLGSGGLRPVMLLACGGFRPVLLLGRGGLRPGYAAGLRWPQTQLCCWAAVASDPVILLGSGGLRHVMLLGCGGLRPSYSAGQRWPQTLLCCWAAVASDPVILLGSGGLRPGYAAGLRWSQTRSAAGPRWPQARLCCWAAMPWSGYSSGGVLLRTEIYEPIQLWMLFMPINWISQTESQELRWLGYQTLPFKWFSAKNMSLYSRNVLDYVCLQMFGRNAAIRRCLMAISQTVRTLLI